MNGCNERNELDEESPCDNRLAEADDNLLSSNSFLSYKGFAAFTSPSECQPSSGYRLITKANDVAELAECIREARLPVRLDTETMGLKPDHDRVRLIQIAIAQETVIVDGFAFDDPKATLAALLDALSTVDIVGHNLVCHIRFLAKLGACPSNPVVLLC